jgi:hypothetical protein
MDNTKGSWWFYYRLYCGKKDKYGQWEKALDVPAIQTTATIPYLIEGQPYEFRVKAVNAAGPGEPSDATPFITTISKCYHSYSHLNNMILR